MSKPKKPGRETATQGLVEGIMQAVATYNAEMGLETPQTVQDATTTAGPIDGPTRRRKSNGTDQAGA